MKHRELIIAAMDGKIIQYKVENGLWHILTQEHAVYSLAVYPDSREYRIKPGPIPDKVFYDVLRNAHCNSALCKEGGYWYSDANSVRRIWGADCTVVKLTTKTDDNGVVTEHVEIVK